MKRGLLFIAVSLISLFGFTQIPSGYYDSAAGLDGEDLREALHQIIKGHTSISYSSIKDTYHEQTDKKSNNEVWDMYSDQPGGTSSYQFTFVDADKCGNYAAEGDCFNREHSFPQSWFNSANPMQTDLFHVYPTDGYVNGRRASLPYGEVSSATWTSSNGSKLGSSSIAEYSGTVFEPIDEYKGDFARTYFYMVTRYKDVASGWTSDMLTGNNLSSWAITMMLDWDDNDPVSQKETDRNNAVHDIQNNRNPYIDNPSYVDAVWAGGQVINGVNDDFSNYTIKIVGNVMQIQNLDNEIEVLNIYSLLGNNVLSEKVNINNKEIPLDLPKGIYISILNDKSQKIVIQ